MLALQSFEDLFRENHAHCLAFAAHYTGDMHEAEEIVQQVFLKLWEKRDTIVITGPVKSYLFSAIRNAAISQWRKDAVRSEKETAYSQQRDAATQAAEVRELEQLYHQALERLPDRCREVFILSRHQQMKYAEIAATMNISVKTVENQMGKALKILHQELKEYLPLLTGFLF
ncbi:RNA polymerase sigma-70 factor, ECF subfamily [Chitinophaga jiangningensis]|uniref:RNA polymerase sigma-70 factor, ECF subfamily n=1 Tax=Chitinophaga jiangningensis TaxID=1419482 RepID=A0A1M6WQ57_9BACT|nr:RNA polymerase sigma-70 factor [Chitinophaga jiangningensis]SHK95903.1 RNA polymerase sigma-70 factor, ECF subfamily [Chitinophaga jiangningensis]